MEDGSRYADEAFGRPRPPAATSPQTRRTASPITAITKLTGLFAQVLHASDGSDTEGENSPLLSRIDWKTNTRVSPELLDFWYVFLFRSPVECGALRAVERETLVAKLHGHSPVPDDAGRQSRFVGRQR